jgi:hypothetical protein
MNTQVATAYDRKGSFRSRPRSATVLHMGYGARSGSRRASFVLLVSLLAFPLSAAQSASGDIVDLACPLSATIHFVPGLTLVPQPVEISGSAAAGTSVSPATPCSSVTGVPYTGASGPVTGTGTVACVTTGLSGSANGTLPITWNNGDASMITWSVTVGGAVPTVSAQVTSGELTGSRILVAPVPTGINGNCLLAPLTSVSFTGVVEFFRV